MLVSNCTQILICVLTFIFTLPVFAQNINISTQILNNQKQGIPFATLTTKKYNVGAFADSIGKITLQIPNSKVDTLLISALGYQSKQFFWKDLPKKIVLEDDIMDIAQAEIIAKRLKNYTKNFGEIGKGFKFAQVELKGTKGTQWAYYVENGTKKDGIIKTVAFNFGIFEKQKNNKIRIRFYAKIRAKESPDKDLLTENIIVDITHGGINRFDVEKYKIPFDKEGCFIGIDLLGNGDPTQKGFVSPIWHGYQPRIRKNISSFGSWSNYMERKWYNFNIERVNLGANLMYVNIEVIL